MNNPTSQIKYDKAIMSRMVRSGIPHKYIAAYFNTSQSAVSTYCSKLKLRSPVVLRKGDGEEAMIVKMISDNEPLAYIVRVTKRNYGVIERIARDYGLVLNKRKPMIAGEILNKILDLLKKRYSSAQIIKLLNIPNVTESQILKLKKRYGVTGLSRGGVSKVPPNEQEYLKQLMADGKKLTEIVDLVNAKFNKQYGYELIRGRCRGFGYKLEKPRPYDENEMELMRAMLKKKMSVVDMVSMFPGRGYNSIKKIREIVRSADKAKLYKEAL